MNSRLVRELTNRTEMIATFRKQLKENNANKHGLTSALFGASRMAAVLEVRLYQNYDRFRQYLDEAVDLFGELVCDMHSRQIHLEWRIYYFYVVLDAWTAYKPSVAGSIAKAIYLEDANSLQNCLGFTIKYLTLGETEAARRAFAEYYSADYPKNYQPYLRFLAAMLDGFETPPEHYLQAIDQAHQREVKLVNSPLYADADAHLCLWGIGLANMARQQGKVDQWNYDSPMIPQALIS